MEIGSMGSMAGMMGMQGMSGMQKPDESEMASNFVDSLDSDDDGLLSQAEFSVAESPDGTDSAEAFDALDTNEDGFVSQDELEADMKSKMEDMKAQMESGMFSGIRQSGDSEEFQQLADMIGSGTGDQALGAERYAQMQGTLFSGMGEQASAGLSLSA
ncbi:hypothetical protein GM415_05225 [Pseudodesulfovibrio cashew]|uniref:EF-hand domain-containing protein n=1 Tax=Pseudodesulfovibrio cashew TaxID=2678688 RepID=A0A6I6JGB3_9BACT|nr:hypothetical protein [Pseudodesulfovibrio cashew]QGY39543.1 hypothetical protein GM415_05225 [Pseudodesulfovibrio cashew]